MVKTEIKYCETCGKLMSKNKYHKMNKRCCSQRCYQAYKLGIDKKVLNWIDA